MRILIYDNNKNDLERFCNMIKLYPIEILVDKASDYEDILFLYSKHFYEKVFIDYDDEIGKKIFSYIVNQNSNQKIFLLCEQHHCLDEDSCLNCIANTKKHFIIKPLHQNQLTKIISKKFTCEKKHLSKKEFNLLKVKKKVHENYPYLKFDYCKTRDAFLSDNIPTSALVFVTDLLSEENIDFHVTHKKQIVIK